MNVFKNEMLAEPLEPGAPPKVLQKGVSKKSNTPKNVFWLPSNALETSAAAELSLLSMGMSSFLSKREVKVLVKLPKMHVQRPILWFSKKSTKEIALWVLESEQLTSKQLRKVLLMKAKNTQSSLLLEEVEIVEKVLAHPSCSMKEVLLVAEAAKNADLEKRHALESALKKSSLKGSATAKILSTCWQLSFKEVAPLLSKLTEEKAEVFFILLKDENLNLQNRKRTKELLEIAVST